MKDAESIIDALIEQKEGREVRRTMLPIDKRKHLHDLLRAAAISITEAEERNLDSSATLDELARLVEDITGSVLEASELLKEQAEQLL